MTETHTKQISMMVHANWNIAHNDHEQSEDGCWFLFVVWNMKQTRVCSLFLQSVFNSFQIIKQYSNTTTKLLLVKLLKPWVTMHFIPWQWQKSLRWAIGNVTSMTCKTQTKPKNFIFEFVAINQPHIHTQTRNKTLVVLQCQNENPHHTTHLKAMRMGWWDCTKLEPNK